MRIKASPYLLLVLSALFWAGNFVLGQNSATYTVTVSGMTQAGTVTATIPANAAQDSV